MIQKMGIDVSSNNGSCNWQSFKNSGKVEFAMIRAGYGRELQQRDKQLTNNINGCKSNGIPYGFYWYSYADSIADAEREANVCLSIIKGTNPKYPVAFDLEDPSLQKLGRATLTQMALTFLAKIKNAGYKTAIYTNPNWINNFIDINSIKSHGHDVWLAKYNGTTPQTINNSSQCQIWQYSDKGVIVGNGSTNIDLNVCYKNYEGNSAIPSATTFKSDTTGTITLQPLGEYQFKITANGMPNFHSNNSNIITTQFIKQTGQDYYFKVKSTGVMGGVGINVGNQTVCIINIGNSSFKSDTNGNVNVKMGQSYQAKITCIQKPVISCADSNVFKTEFVKQIGTDWYFKITAIGNVGKSVGFYINGGKTPAFTGTIIS